MAQPDSIEDLCRYLDIYIWDLQLNCLFCKDYLANTELCAFMYKDLKLTWKGGYPYGICYKCTILKTRELAFRHHDWSAYARTVETDCGLPLSDIRIRCVVCLIPLREEDKVRHLTRHRRFIKVAGYWRGRCTHCWNTPL
ncbi:early protein E6 [Alouatta guariba papillomavirus 1]|uniref:Protein E6 n=1 Tax=Alouatta guariba papillomavirus 1 TaxID=1784959 RepID=A0A140CC03_9PAPI|nr:early protein E6 [Alouatta guariba papillomavirus 1]AMB19785.1 early protein E6 [Alouatta guariba papillomavirus 1]